MGFACIDENISNSWSGHRTRLALSTQDVFVVVQRKQNGQIKVNLMENKKCICQNRKTIDPITFLMHISALIVHGGPY